MIKCLDAVCRSHRQRYCRPSRPRDRPHLFEDKVINREPVRLPEQAVRPVRAKVGSATAWRLVEQLMQVSVFAPEDRMKTIHEYVSGLAIMMPLSACGGATPVPPPVPTFNDQAATNALHASGANVNFTATQTGSATCSGSANIIISPVSTATVFDLTPRRAVNAVSSTTTTTWNWTGCSPAHNVLSESDFFSIGNYQALGYTTDNTCAVFLNAPS